LIGNYQKLGLYQAGKLNILSPVKHSAEYAYDPHTFTLTPLREEMTSENIAYYQTASYLYQNGLYRELSAAEQARYARDAAAGRAAK